MTLRWPPFRSRQTENVLTLWIAPHQTLRVTPAMEAGVSTRVWNVSDIVALIDTENAEKAA